MYLQVLNVRTAVLLVVQHSLVSSPTNNTELMARLLQKKDKRKRKEKRSYAYLTRCCLLPASCSVSGAELAGLLCSASQG